MLKNSFPYQLIYIKVFKYNSNSYDALFQSNVKVVGWFDSWKQKEM